MSVENEKIFNSLVRQMVDLIQQTREDVPWEVPSKTYDESYGGGECSKHGRYYGRCACCDREMKMHYEHQRRRFEYDRKRKLEELARQVKSLLMDDQS